MMYYYEHCFVLIHAPVAVLASFSRLQQPAISDDSTTPGILLLTSSEQLKSHGVHLYATK